MSGGIFSFLDAASPWWWVALAFGLGAFELVTFSYFLLWLSLAALSVGGVLWISPDLSGIAQFAWFAGLSIVYTAAGWAIIRKRTPQEVDTGLNSRASALVGRFAVVTGPFRGGVGPVEIDGIRWRGRLDGAASPDMGEELEVTGADGMLLTLTRRAKSAA
ncbi:MAG: NfeD family protein [Pseudomonadota bacterium]